MARDRAIGSALVVGAVIGVFVYGFLLFYPFSADSKIALYTLEVTAFVAVLAILAILGWIGYVMATTPPPVPLEPEPTPTMDTPSSGETSSGMTSEKKA
ncbi:MAG: transcriptional regulator [Thaumarchaeota archaeon]|nr:transcriptional regulator [Nitrososphaerota archaeon]